ncbi:MAG: hypothetical protein JST46_02710 [Bacteroidetes bacterium]|nr:hypothetical protein [Bacteroidota bacterium]
MKKHLLKYLVEIVIIFIGITLSFVFEEMRDNRKSLQDRKEILQSLLVDLEIKGKEIADDLLYCEGFMNSADTCLALSIMGKEISQEQMDKLIASIGNDYSFFGMNSPSYLGLSTSDAWQELPDSLRREIFFFFNTDFGYIEQAYGKLTEYASHVKINQLTSHHFQYYENRSKLKNISVRKSAEGLEQMQTILKHPDFRSAILLVRNQYDQCIVFQQALIRDQKRLSDHLRNYLKSL